MQFRTDDGTADIAIRKLIVAGWTGRDAAAVQHHIEELAAIGVAPPSEVPLYYRVSHSLLTTAPEIEVLGAATSGEAEPLVIRHDGRLWLGLASDHTDRELEATSVAASKQACAKPCAMELWPLPAAEAQLEAIEIRSWIPEGDGWVLYQEGTLGQIRPLAGLIAAAGMAEGAAMLCGTFAAKGGVRPASRFRAEMRDPATGREMRLDYGIACLPVVR